MEIKEPTSKQCSDNEKVFEDEISVGYAIWYPQMGGYVGWAVAVLDKSWRESEHFSDGGCIDIFVWHDGEFPFGGDSPRELHHCNPAQFIEFGKTLLELNERGKTIVHGR